MPSNRKYPGIVFKQQREVGNQILNVERLAKSLDGKPLFGNIRLIGLSTDYALGKIPNGLGLIPGRLAPNEPHETR